MRPFTSRTSGRNKNFSQRRERALPYLLIAPTIFVLTNTGSLPLNVTNFNLTGPNAADFGVTLTDDNGALVTANSFTVPAGKGYVVKVRLQSTTIGSKSATLSFNTSGNSNIALGFFAEARSN